jgi:molybdopterin molybdotransferase
MVSASAWTRGDARREFLRARVTADGRVELYPNQGSGVLTSCAWADGLIDNPPGGTFQPGDSVRFLQFPGRA